ncbi:MAG: winged helix-turn-helix domain-containing protein [Gammaproteobacteria bacterium]
MDNASQHTFQDPVRTGIPAFPETCGLSLQSQGYRACVNGIVVELGPTRFKLLRLLINSRGRLLTRTQIIDSVWGRSVYIEDRTLDAHILRLRKALEPFGKADLIQTVSGTGYRFSVQNQPAKEESSQ